LVLGRALVAACVASSGAFAQVRFTETHRLVPTGAALPLSAIGGDFDGDGDRDVVVGDSERDGVGALLVDVGGRFERAACVQAPADFEYGAAGDVDGDGDLDLATTGGLQINQGGCFVDAATLLASSPALGGISVALGDVDGDGDLDIVTNDFNTAPMVLISNLTEKTRVHYVAIKLVGTTSNRDGLGAVVKVNAGGTSYTKVYDGNSGYLSHSLYPLYFGLGTAESVDGIEVVWPSGKTQTVTAPGRINSVIEVREQ
jgi:hypothetical protein